MARTPHGPDRARPAGDRAPLLIAVTAWVLAAAAGMSALWAYALEPGAAADAPARWPRECSIAPDAGRPTLIVLAHPLCPCTRATLEELGRLIARCAGELSAHVLFYRPAGADPDWARGELWRTAAAIPGVTVHEDPDGVEVRRFGAVVSGQTLLYDRTGVLRFRGGLTAGRGHAGDNEGLDAVLRFLAGHSARSDAPVYGCDILGAEVRR